MASTITSSTASTMTTISSLHDPIVHGQVIQGAGVGLRTPHLTNILEQPEPLSLWFELLADNWLATGGLNRAYVEAICEIYPITLHGVGLSLGGVTPLDLSYLKKIKQLKIDTKAKWYSEHACFSHTTNAHTHDLLPLPYTEEAQKNLVQRIKQVQDYLEDHILLENVSSYITFKDSQVSEGEFLKQVADDADCYLLLDINNFYVTQKNHGINAREEISRLPANRIKEIHLAGYEDKGKFLLDAHNNPVSDPVWQLYEECIIQLGPVPTLIEWDNDLPELEVLLAERVRAQQILDKQTDSKEIQLNDSAVESEVSYEAG